MNNVYKCINKMRIDRYYTRNHVTKIVVLDLVNMSICM